MRARIVEGPEVIQLVEDVVELDRRLDLTIRTIRHLLDLHSGTGLQLEPAMQVLQNLHEEITQVPQWKKVTQWKKDAAVMRPQGIPGYLLI